MTDKFKKQPSNFIHYMVSNPVAANLLMLVFLVGGFFCLSNTTQEIFPDFSEDTISISVSYSGSSPEEIEEGIILPIENALKEVENIKEVDSTASEGSGTVTAEIMSTDLMFQAYQDIKGAVDRITTFPDDAEEPNVTLVSRKRGVVNLVVYGNASDESLRTAADYIEEAMDQDTRIGPVDTYGARDYEIHVDLKQDALRKYGLTISDVSSKIKETALDLPGGSLETDQGDIMVRMKERRDSASDFADIVMVTSETGSVVRLSDIADVTSGLDDSRAYFRYNGEPAIRLGINRVGEQTPVSVVSAVREKLPEIEAALPQQLKVAVLDDRSEDFVGRAKLLLNNGYWGLGLVIIFLALFLDIRLALWVSMGIPVSFLGSFFLIGASGIDFSINMISMFAYILTLGIVVDDAVVVGENIYSKREKGLSPLQAAYEGVKEVGIPVCFSVLTNIIAFLPLIFLPGRMGKIFSVLPIVVIAVFTVSLIESLFVLPSHLTFKKSKTVKNKVLAKIISWQKAFNIKFNYFVTEYYGRFLEKAIELRYITIAVALAALIISFGYVASGRMGISLFPRVESDFAIATITMPSGTAEEIMDSVERRLDDSAQKIVQEHGGDQLAVGISTFINENSVESRMYLQPADTRPLSTSEVTNLWRQEIGEIAGAETQSFESNFGGPGAGAALTVELSHSDINLLEDAAIELGKILPNYAGVSDVDDGTAAGKTQYDFTVNALGHAYGLTSSDIAQQVRNAFQGQEALKQQEGGNEITVRVRLEEQERSSANDIENLIIRTPDDAEVYLKDVVNINIGQAYTNITRRDNRRVMSVTADVDPPSQAQVVADYLDQNELQTLKQKYPGLTWSFQGQQADLQESQSELFAGLLFVVFMIYTLMAVLFKSYWQPFIVMVVIPFSTIGALVGHIIMGFSISLMSMMGLLALVGVVVNDSLVFIDRANNLNKEHSDKHLAIHLAGIQRFRAIILTTLTTFIGLAPMIFETSRQSIFLVPMAISLGFGILFATFITLVLIPALYMVGEDFKKIVKKDKKNHLPNSVETEGVN